jgi:hypothetical protein
VRTEVRLTVLQTSFAVHGLSSATTARLRFLLEPFLGEATDEPDVVLRFDMTVAGWTISGGGETISGTADAVSSLVAAINRLALQRTQLFAVHAGVVSRSGSVLAFPCSSGCGKSTLTAGLLQQGAEYVSDEALCIDRSTGQVIPYPKPIALSAWSEAALGLPASQLDGETLYRPSQLGADVAGEVQRLRHIVRLARREGAPNLTPLPPSASVADLLMHSFNHFHAPRASWELIGRLARSVSMWLLEYDNPVEGAKMVDTLLTGSDESR